MLAIIAVLLSACSLSGGGRSVAWRHGYHAGQAARQRHQFRQGASKYDVTTFCAETAIDDIQDMKNSIVQWTEGFENGCSGRG